MASTKLSVLLSLRRSAEEEAKRALGEAIAARLQIEEEQARLDQAAKQACVALAQETRRRATGPAPTAVAAGLSRELYRQRLAASHARAAERAAQHRHGPLDRAQACENAATACFRRAKQERQAVEKLMAHQAADQRKQAKRRTEDAVDDWVHAFQSRRTPR